MKLDLYHHKFIMAVLVIVVFVVGVLFGVKVSSVADIAGMQVLNFGLLFLNAVLLYVLFTQMIHVRDDIARCMRGKKK